MKWMKTCIETHKPTPKPTRSKIKMRCNPLFYWDQRIFIVPGTGIEPVQPQWPQDFKSCVSTSSTTRASEYIDSALKKNPDRTDQDFIFERETRLELATLTLARLCSTN